MNRGLLLMLFLCLGFGLWAQEPIRFGDREVYLEANVRSAKRGQKRSSLELGVPSGARLNVLVQAGAEGCNWASLKEKGIVLGDYLGNNAYYATIAPGSSPSDFVGTGLRTVQPIRGEWKLMNSILQKDAPSWGKEGELLKVSLTWFSTVDWEFVKKELEAKRIAYRSPSEIFRNVELTASYDALLALSEQEFVAHVRWTKPPMVVENFEGRHVAGGTFLAVDSRLGGRGLTGKGIRIGIWDGNVAEHVDYGKRVHRKEFELSVLNSGAHGMHTTGTILGGGMRNQTYRGVAPEAEIWTYNFNVQSNGLEAEEEMYMAALNEHITLTSNSYGMDMRSLCRRQSILNYSYLGQPNLDLLAYYIPTLTHVFSAGNSQGACGWRFSHVSNYGKNIISVAAVKHDESITNFSSFGPTLDGRMFPIISSLGESVWSTTDHQSYYQMSGTSMSCPNVTGHLALLTQRFKQLNGGAIPYNYFLKALIANTARDAGNQGPDYKYGFGILDAVAAVTAMENNWYKLDKRNRLASGVKEFTIDVPEDVQELRVTICWNDPVANKEYATGENPMVNNLNLRVSANGTTHLPLTLDWKKPNQLAVEKVNDADNIEQVVWKTPAPGKYTISVDGSVNQGENQEYAVVWYFDYKKPEIVAPIAGEVYVPGTDMWIRTRNMKAPLKVELSLDGGKTFKLLDGQFNENSKYKLEDRTENGVLRITDAEGTRLESGEFAILSRLIQAKLTYSECSTEGWVLSWKKAYEAKKYEVLQADLENEKWEVIAEIPQITSGRTVKYNIPKERIAKGRNLFTARLVTEKGIRGLHAVMDILPSAYVPKITADKLPYHETFRGWPLTTGLVETGRNLDFKPLEALPELRLPFNSTILAWYGKTAPTDWDSANPFDVANKDNIGSIKICELDLTELEAGTKLHLFAHTLMLQAEGDPTGSQLRLLVNGKEHPDVEGRLHIIGDGEEHRPCWDLSEFVGKTISLKFEGAMKTSDDGVAIVQYRLIKQTELSDVGIAWVNDPEIKSKANIKDANIRFNVQNYSSIDLKDVPVSIQVDGKVVYTTTINLKPFGDQIITYKHNFYSKEAHKFKVEVRTDCKDDYIPENNYDFFEVYNIGDVIPMSELQVINFLGMLIPYVPFDRLEVEGTKQFVDGRGALEKYYQRDRGVLQLLPKHENGVIQVTFLQRDFARYDTLYVYTDDVPQDLKKIDITDASLRLSGKTSEPLTLISGAQNGGLTFAFKAENRRPSEGWIAEVSEVLLPNQWAITELKTRPTAENPQIHEIYAVVKNFIPTPHYKVPIFITQNGLRKRYEIPVLNANTDTEFVLPQKLNVTPPIHVEIKAELPKDGDANDNSKEYRLVDDGIWNGGGLIKDPKALYISSLRPSGTRDTFQFKPSKEVYCYGENKLHLYLNRKNGVAIDLSNTPKDEQLPATLHLWIDFDKNNLLDDAKEGFTAVLEKGTKTYQIDLDLAKVAALQAGEYALRLLLTKDSELEHFKTGKEITWGHAIAMTAAVHDGASPNDYELALVAFDDLKSGRKLNNATDIKVKVRNNGIQDQTKLELICSLDGGAEFTEEFDCQLLVRQETVVTLKKKADFAQEGKHTVTVRLKNPDSYTKDNELKTTVYKIPPRTPNLYALRFDGKDDEGILLQNVGREVPTEGAIEGWWRLDKPQNCAFADGGRVGVWMGTVTDNPDFRDNTLIFMTGAVGLWASEHPVVKPGQWQHIAISFYQSDATGKLETTPEAYVDGVKVSMRSISHDGFRFLHLGLNVQLRGENAMFRLWKTQRTKDQFDDNRIKSVREASGKLHEDCVGEYIYTEGHGNTTASGDDRFALILANRDNLWKKIESLVSSLEVAGQLIPVKWKNDHEATATMPTAFNNFSSVKVKFAFHWEGMKVTLKESGEEVTESTELDFSKNADHKLQFKVASQDLFGMPIEQELTLQLINDLSGACDLIEIAMPKDKNSGLKEDMSITNPENFIVWEAENASSSEIFDAKHAKLVVKQLSPNAKIYLGDKEISLNTEFEADLTKAIKLRVVAENGRDMQYYKLHLAMTQTIAWGTDKLTYAFSGTPSPLDAKASSGLPVSYYSVDPAIVTVDANGNLVTGAVGETTIFARQQGNEQYKPASEVSRRVEVTGGIPLTIKMKPAKMPQGDELPEFEFEFEGLQFEDTEDQFEYPYVVKLKDGTFWDASMPPLAIGDYEVVPKDYAGPYASGSYMVTRTQGTLTVGPAVSAQAVTFEITDENGAPCADVKVECNGVTYMTKADGIIVTYLPDGEYDVIASKDGYEFHYKEFKVEGAPVTVDLQVLREIYTMTYTADANGIISGKANQKAALHSNGDEVVAVPRDAQHRFKEWDDGVKTAARRDEDVQANIDVRAIFEEFFYTLTYKVTDGGEFTTPEATQNQTKAYGEDAQTVTVQPKAGYIFMGWTDGNMDLNRTDKAITNNIDVTAVFLKPILLPWAENVEREMTIFQGWNYDRPKKGIGWRVLLTKVFNAVTNPKGHVLAIAPIYEYPIPEYTNCWVATPWFSLKEKEAATTKLQLSYTCHIKNGVTNKAALEYTFDGITWTELATLTSDKPATLKKEHEIPVATLGANTHIRFRWRLTAPNTYAYIALDDLELTFDNVTHAIMRYYAAENGFLQEDGKNEKVKSLEFKTNGTDPAPKVTAVPEEGYHFLKWSDEKVTTADRQDTENVTTEAIFMRNKCIISYLAAENGTIAGITTQIVPEGSTTSMVTAVGNKGYEFAQWNDGAKLNPRTDIADKNKTFTATFTRKIPTYKVTLKVWGEGTLEVVGYDANKLDAVPENTKLTFKAEPKDPEKYELTLLEAGENNSIIDTKEHVVVADVRIKAVFKKKKPVAVTETLLSKVVVAPNPFSSQLRVKSEELLVGRYELLNTSGQVLISGVLQEGETLIRTEEIPEGVYLLRLVAHDGKTEVRKVVKN